MARPELIYYAAMFLVALPVAWIAKSKVAALVFAVWAVGQALWLIGFPEPQTQLVIYAAAFGTCWRWRDGLSLAGLFSAILFLPLTLVCLAEIGGTMSPYEAWWTIYWIAMTQVAALPFVRDWRALWRERRVERDGGAGISRRVSLAA